MRLGTEFLEPDLFDVREWRAFRAELRAATRVNRRSALVRSFPTPRAAMLWLQENLPYRFNPNAPVADLETALARGYGACAEAAAVIAAQAQTHRLRQVKWCLELRRDLPRYAHVVPVVQSEAFDTYAAAAREVTGCAFIWAVR